MPNASVNFAHTVWDTCPAWLALKVLLVTHEHNIPWKNSQNFCQKIGPIDKLSEKLLKIWILQFFLKNLTNFVTNYSAASWKKFRRFFIGYFDLSTFQKSENLIQILRNFLRILLIGPSRDKLSNWIRTLERGGTQ